MTLVFMDSFDHYPTANLLQKWDLVSGATIRTAAGEQRFGVGQNFLVGNVQYAKKQVPEHTTYTVGVAIFGNTLGSACHPVSFWDRSLFCHGYVQLDNLGSGASSLSIRRFTVPNATTVTLTPSLDAHILILQGRWYWFELKWLLDATVGFIECRIDGTVALQFSGNTIGTGNLALHSWIGLGSQFSGGGHSLWLDDVYMASGDATPPNDFLGERRVYALNPSGVGNVTDFTRVGAAASNWQAQQTSDGDTNYVVAGTIGNTDLYAFDDLPATVSSIDAIQWNLTVRKEDVGNRSVRGVLRSGGTNYPTAAVPIQGSQYFVTRIIAPMSLATAVAWTLSEVNAAEFGLRVA